MIFSLPETQSRRPVKEASATVELLYGTIFHSGFNTVL
jgi:hypothetical protein